MRKQSLTFLLRHKETIGCARRRATEASWKFLLCFFFTRRHSNFLVLLFVVWRNVACGWHLLLIEIFFLAIYVFWKQMKLNFQTDLLCYIILFIFHFLLEISVDCFIFITIKFFDFNPVTFFFWIKNIKMSEQTLKVCKTIKFCAAS